MTRTRAIIIVLPLLLCAVQAHAAIPVDDAAQLTLRSQTSGTTIKLVPVTTQRKDANKGVNCAVTTGKKASVTDPTVQPQAGAGANAIRSYSPDLPGSPDPSAKGGALNIQTLFQSAGTVTGGIGASRSTLGAAQSAFNSARHKIGTGDTVMAALDMNSAARLQNNLALNNVIGSANLWVTALNALNVSGNSDVSRVAGGMRAAPSSRQSTANPACPLGMIGSGTAADPCRLASTCQTTPPGSTPDPACVSGRYVDTETNVLSYLDQFQNAARAATSASNQ